MKVGILVLLLGATVSAEQADTVESHVPVAKALAANEQIPPINLCAPPPHVGQIRTCPRVWYERLGVIRKGETREWLYGNRCAMPREFLDGFLLPWVLPGCSSIG
jgi:hypothetical protein